jgi:hypothetical protein
MGTPHANRRKAGALCRVEPFKVNREAETIQSELDLDARRFFSYIQIVAKASNYSHGVI